MPPDAPADSWTTQQLVEFLASVTRQADREETIRTALEEAAAALDAEVAALVADERVVGSIGFPAAEEPTELLVEAAGEPARSMEVPGLGRCEVAVAPVEEDEDVAALLVARCGTDAVLPEEEDLLRGMGRVLGLALSSGRAVTALRERQELLERLSRLQRSIASRVDLQEVLDSIVAGAAELIGDEVSVLRQICADDEGQTEIVSTIEADEELLAEIQRVPVGVGVGGRAIESGELVVLEDYGESDHANPRVAESGMQAAMSAPIFERGRIVGCLTVGTRKPGRTYSAGERDVLKTFAEHAGLALNDAQSVAETIHQAFHDSLTDLPNRALFLDRLEHALARARRRGDSVGVLYIDLDGFKTVNDSLGHAAGDELLVAVGARMVACLRDADTVARLGGDEFAVLLEDYGDHGAPSRVAGRILSALEDPFNVRGRPIYVSASIGIAGGRESSEHLLRNADLAMYRAKGSGKGRFELFEPGMHDEAVNRLELQVDLKRALERREFRLQYQPIVSLRDGRIVGLEALARWHHPARGVVPPLDFIPLAEESRQIVEIGRWVLDEASARAARWIGLDAPPNFELGVNLSGVQLEHPDLVDQVADGIARSGLPASSLVLEITETALMSDTRANVAKLNALKEIGVKLAVDDFGTGYSSLRYLRQFPIDILKVAKSFVDGLRGTAEGQALVRAIVDLADTFGVRVIAEGIELAEQRTRLLEMGCAVGQGFLFSRPVDPADAEALVRASRLPLSADLGAA